MEISKKEYDRLIYWARVGKGLCTECGKRNASRGVRLCRECQIKRTARYREKKEGKAHDGTARCNIDWAAVHTGLGNLGMHPDGGEE